MSCTDIPVWLLRLVWVVESMTMPTFTACMCMNRERGREGRREGIFGGIPYILAVKKLSFHWITEGIVNIFHFSHTTHPSATKGHFNQVTMNPLLAFTERRKSGHALQQVNGRVDNGTKPSSQRRWYYVLSQLIFSDGLGNMLFPKHFMLFFFCFVLFYRILLFWYCKPPWVSQYKAKRWDRNSTTATATIIMIIIIII